MANKQFQCLHCGQDVDLSLYKHNDRYTAAMKSKQLCFDCVYWEHELEDLSSDKFIIDGKLYQITLSKKCGLSKTELRHPGIVLFFTLENPKPLAGFIKRYIGIVPEKYLSRFSQQYKFISKELYIKLVEYQGTCCMAKGCFDRYHCFWYHPEIAEPNGPWNKIPDTYKTGSEMCESFIDKSKMYKNV